MTAPVLSKTPPPGTPPPTRPSPAPPGPRPTPTHPQPSGPPKVAYRPVSDFTWGHKPGEATGEGSAASPSSRLVNERIRGGWHV